MRILFATYWSIPKEGRLNRYLNLLKKELEQHGHQVDILAHHPGMQQIYMQSDCRRDEFARDLIGLSVDKPKIKNVIYSEVYGYYQKYLPHVHPWIRWREIERYTFELAVSLFDLEQYDLIHTHDIVSTRALWRVKPEYVSLVYQNHGILANDHLSKGEIASKASLRWKYAVAEEFQGALSSDQTIVPSRRAQKELHEKFGVPVEKGTIIPYGMDVDSFVEWLQYEPYPAVEKSPNTFVISCPANLVPEKGHQTLLEALGILKQKRSDFVCWLIGDGKLRGELERNATEQGVADSVIFLGERFDLPSLLNKTDIVVVASTEDEQPDAIMEAQVAGKAIVAANSGVIPEMIEEGETGLLFQAGNSAELADRLLEVMTDPGLRLHLQNQAKEAGLRWRSQGLAERMLEMYDQVQKSPRLLREDTIQKTTLDDRSDAARLFLFKPNRTFDQNEWQTVANRLPIAYSIPDTAFLRVLTETNRFDE